VALFIIDEAHAVAGSEKYRTLLFRYNRVPCIGLSATPLPEAWASCTTSWRRPLFEDLVSARRCNRWWMRALTDLDMYAPSSPDMTGAKTSRTAEGEQDYGRPTSRGRR
jgi:hypothetical protein